MLWLLDLAHYKTWSQWRASESKHIWVLQWSDQSNHPRHWTGGRRSGKKWAQLQCQKQSEIATASVCGSCPRYPAMWLCFCSTALVHNKSDCTDPNIAKIRLLWMCRSKVPQVGLTIGSFLPLKSNGTTTDCRARTILLRGSHDSIGKPLCFYM